MAELKNLGQAANPAYSNLKDFENTIAAFLWMKQ